MKPAVGSGCSWAVLNEDTAQIQELKEQKDVLVPAVLMGILCLWTFPGSLQAHTAGQLALFLPVPLSYPSAKGS